MRAFALAVVLAVMAIVAPAARAASPILVGVSPPIVSDSGILTVEVANLDLAKNVSPDPTQFRLRLDGHRLDGILPQFTAPDAVSFDLSSLEKDDKADWTAIVGSPPLLGVKTVSVAIATTGGGTTDFDVLTADGKTLVVGLRIFSAALVLLVFVVFLLLAGLLWRLGAKTAMLRDPPAANTPLVQQRPYSLGRCQMAFWLVVITVSFVAIVCITGDYNGIVTAQSLTLLGISSATAFGAKAIEVSKSGGTSQAGQPLATGPAHTTFLQDLLTDDSGFALHRVQILVWTLILGVVSLWSVYRSLTLPDFDGNLLVMMGISSGLYLGFKWPEQQTNSPLPQQPNAVAPPPPNGPPPPPPNGPPPPPPNGPPPPPPNGP